ncbi:phenylalanine--tRNA ligase subunit beta [Bifidobacterium aquikefiri]|uniref:phenylalanine--tRNA ligase subunit beta n=1 Tax=Bifidobacterium aquikefiri TaxID=1653207 RepID=UPI0023F42410|nr:phenylalanine--tRNA ligase subunit beta [Bifidobacterium aquikefiri]
MPMVDIDWLAEHVKLPADLSYEQLAKDLVRVGLEEEMIHTTTIVGPIVVGYVVSAEPEEQKNGKTINWCKVDVGDEYNDKDEDGQPQPRGIVCGAPNMAAGEKVVVTLPGAVLPGDFKIEPRKTYGHISDGMCASERELGLSEEHNGILLLRNYGFTKEQYDALKPGDDVMHLLHLDNPILEINITPDRGYAFSYRGVAREYHNSTGAKFTDPVLELNRELPKPEPAMADGPKEHRSEVSIEIEDSNPIHDVVGCDRYYARIIRGYDASQSHTPHVIRRRLVRAGMRSLSLPVDVTNYVMMDLGQPLHAYDLDKISMPIVVRRAIQGESLVTLDGKRRELNPEDLLITDSPEGNRASRILGLAGVMGGQYGEVTEDTKNILIESAHFDPITIARSARRHKLPSEASRRFERGVDTMLQPAAAQMAVDMLVHYGQGEASSAFTDVDSTKAPKPIHFKAREVARLAGLNCDLNEISSRLQDIGCRLGGGGNGEFLVAPPTWRPDLTEACDLVEEIARLVGYDKIPVKVPSAPVLGKSGLTPQQLRRRWVADTLAEYGLVETLSYPFVGEEDFKAFSVDAQKIEPVSVELQNPLAGDRPYLRRELLMTLALTAQRNIRRGMHNVSVYELGSVFLWDPKAPAIPALPGGVRPSDDQLKALDAGLPQQPLHVAGILTGDAEHSGWLGESRSVDWTDAVEIVHRISDRIGAHLTLHQPQPADVESSWHPGRTAQVVLPDGSVVGTVGEFHPHVNEALDFPEHTAAFELNLTDLLDAVDSKPVQAKPISTFPPVRQDLAFTVPKTVTADQLTDCIRKSAGSDLESVELFDVYTGDQVEEQEKSLAFSVTFRSAEKTLTSQDSEQIRKHIVDAAKDLGAVLRA